MDDDDIARLADIVSERVFASMAKFIDVLEDLVRDNEALRVEVDDLRAALGGPDDDEGMYDDGEYLNVTLVPAVNDDGFFDVDGAQEPEDDDSDPTFD